MSGRHLGANNLPARYATLSPRATQIKPLPTSPSPSPQYIPSPVDRNSTPRDPFPLAREPAQAMPSAAGFNYAGRGAHHAPLPGYAPSIRSIDSGVGTVYTMCDTSSNMMSSRCHHLLLVCRIHVKLQRRYDSTASRTCRDLFLCSLTTTWTLTKPSY